MGVKNARRRNTVFNVLVLRSTLRIHVISCVLRSVGSWPRLTAVLVDVGLTEGKCFIHGAIIACGGS